MIYQHISSYINQSKHQRLEGSQGTGGEITGVRGLAIGLMGTATGHETVDICKRIYKTDIMFIDIFIYVCIYLGVFIYCMYIFIYMIFVFIYNTYTVYIYIFIYNTYDRRSFTRSQ